MNTNSSRISDAIERLLPFIIVVAISVVGYFYFLQAPLTNYFQARTNAVSLADRVRVLQESAARAVRTPAGDYDVPLRDFEKRVAKEDRVADVTGILAKAVLECAPPDKLREFAIETGDRVGSMPGSAAGRFFPGNPVTLSSSATLSDVRFSLFPVTLSYTPVRVTFASTFDAIAGFMWRVRDLPTTVEIRSATLTRGLPLMKLDVMIWVYQRGDMGAGAPGSSPAGPPGQPAASPTAPRVAMAMDAGRQ